MKTDNEITMLSLVNTPVQKIEDSVFSSFEKIPETPYDTKAIAYEWLVRQYVYNKCMWGTSPRDYVNFAREAVLGNSQTTLDIGCGGLGQTADIYSKVTFPLVLLDYSVKMLQLGKTRIVSNYQEISPNLLFLQADAFKLPFDNNAFGNVISFGMVHMFENKKAFINEALRVLKPDGSFYFSILTTDRRFSRKYLNFLYEKKEVGKPESSDEILALFSGKVKYLKHNMVGSMLFVRGEK